MASTQGIARKLGWLLTCLTISGMGCDDDNAADGGGQSASDHAADHAANGTHDGDEHGGAAGGASEHDDEHDTSVPVGPLTGAKCPDSGSTLTYDNFGKKFFSDYCLSCHSTSVKGADRHDAPADHNFDGLEDIELLAPHIDEYAGSGPDATNVKMPPTDPKPTKEERQKLSEWLACGAAEK
jgi:hypothetical protein